MGFPVSLRPLTAALLALVAGGWTDVADAQGPPRQPTGRPPLTQTGVPAVRQGVGITDRTGEQVPAGMVLRDHAGEPFELDAMFDGVHPVLLTFNYAACPMLCGQQLGGLALGLRGIDSWSAGDKFQVGTVGLAPTETDEEALKMRTRVLGDYDREGAEDGWHFVRAADDAEVRRLADAVGFGFNYDPSTGLYAHAAVAVLLTPTGTVARYLQGIGFDPPTLRLSLAETAAGELRSFIEEIALFCFSYDPAAGGFVAQAWNITRAILGLIAIGLFGMIIWLVRLERRHNPRTAA